MVECRSREHRTSNIFGMPEHPKSSFEDPMLMSTFKRQTSIYECRPNLTLIYKLKPCQCTTSETYKDLQPKDLKLTW